MEEHDRNYEIAHFLHIWEWCSRSFHVKWKRKPKYRNSCLVGIAYAIKEGIPVPGLRLTDLFKTHQTLPDPLLNETAVLVFWEANPSSLLDMSLGSFTKGSPLLKRLDHIRLARQDNPVLDEIAKKMRSREERFGDDWYFEGHHPEREYVLLKKQMAPLCDQIRDLLVEEFAAVGRLARRVLALGPWRGEVPPSWCVRKTPESLLNRATRLKLWQAAQEVLAKGLEEEEQLETLCEVLYRKLILAWRDEIHALCLDFLLHPNSTPET
jgi:hypothetical protein